MAVLGRTPSQPLGRAVGRRIGVPAVSILAAGFVAAAALLPVAQSSNATSTGREIRLLESRRADLNARIYQTQSVVAQLGAIEGVERRARGALGMVPADRWMYVSVAQPAPVAGMPARFLNEEETPADHRPLTWWQAAIDRLPVP